MRVRVVLGLGLGLVALVGGCGDDDETATASGGPGVEADLLTVHAVTEVTPPPCADPAVAFETTCLLLGPAVIDAGNVAESWLVRGADDVLGVGIDLDDAGDAAMNELAAQQFPTGGLAAMVVRGRVVSAPTIAQPSFDDAGLAVHGLTDEEAIALVTDLGGDPTVPDAVPTDPAMDEASAACDSFAPQVGEGAEVMLAILSSAGQITAMLGDDAIEPWRLLPADHVVAQCGYTLPGAEPFCPVQRYVDAEGNSSEVPSVATPGAPEPPAPPSDAVPADCA